MTTDRRRPLTEAHVLAVLTGTPLSTVAANLAIAAADLDDAIALYRAAGRAALATAQDDAQHWRHVSIEFPDWNTAERTVADHLLPLLSAAERDGEVTCWWFLRKAPCWRLRLHTPGEPTSTLLGDTLDALVARRLITGWRPGRYEPETVAFGGDDAMTVAHRLFHADSRAILTHLPLLASRRRELSLLLCTALLRASGQDWHEQGDIWHRASRLRPLPADMPIERIRAMTAAVHRLLSTDTTAHNGPLRDLRPWADAFTRAGYQLADTAQRNALHRGLRDILAHHIIFHWNRLGIPARTQAILAHAAAQAILHE